MAKMSNGKSAKPYMPICVGEKSVNEHKNVAEIDMLLISQKLRFRILAK